MKTCSMKQKYMLSICMYFWATPFVLPSILRFSWHCHRIKPKGLQLKLSSLPSARSCLLSIYSMLSFFYAFPSRNTLYVFWLFLPLPRMLLHFLSGPGYTFAYHELPEVFHGLSFVLVCKASLFTKPSQTQTSKLIPLVFPWQCFLLFMRQQFPRIILIHSFDSSPDVILLEVGYIPPACIIPGR